MTDQDKILNFLQLNGPSLPAKVAKTINSEILLASALLSDLISQGKVKVSRLKVGGSPLYFLPGQEDRLYQFASGNINPKDLQVLNLLKEKKVLRESDSDLLMKVSLRSLKDFAVPLQVTANDAKELFWKWHLLSEEETNGLIKRLISPTKTIPIPLLPVTAEPTLPSPNLPSQKEADSKEQLSSESELPKQTSPPPPLTSPEEHKVFIEDKKETMPEVDKEPIKEVKRNIKEEILEKQEKLVETKIEDKKPFLQVVKEKITRKKKVDELLPPIENYFNKLRINIEQKETVRKNAEMNFLLKVPTAIGKMTYFCKAKQKKRCDEKDLSSAYMEAQMKKLPLLFLYTNELSKKAEEMLDSGTFENVVVKRVKND